MGSMRRAIDDLGEGMGSLLGVGGSRPALVEELLGEGRGRPAPPRRVRSGPSRAARTRRAPVRAHLVRVK
jgi:hypothetical protein